VAFLELLDALERTTPAAVRVIHIICANVRTH
jgi:hypothetical protein